MNSTLVFCPRCGAATTPDVCDNCGYVFETETEEEAKKDNLEKEPNNDNKGGKKKKNRVWLIALLVAGTFVAFIALILVVTLLIGGAILYEPLMTYYNKVNSINNNPPSVTIVTDNDEDEEKEEEEIEDEDELDSKDDEKDTNESDDDLDENDSSDESSYYDDVTAYSELELDIDYEFLQDYLDSANEYEDAVADDKNDIFLSGSFSNSGATHYGYDRDSYPTPYFDPLMESYVPCDGYEVTRHIIKYDANVNGVLLSNVSSYYELSSDTVDFTKANQAMYDKSIQRLYQYLKADVDSKADNYTYKIYTDAFITYNDDNIISVIYEVNTLNAENRNETLLLYSVNVDVRTGEVMDNTKIFDFNDEFVELFVERCTNQMGYHDYVNRISYDEIKALFSEPQSLILYFTPVGLEIGYQYKYQSTYGWITCSINDFDKYMSGKYDFDTSFGLNYDVYDYEKKYGTYNERYGITSKDSDIDMDDVF